METLLVWTLRAMGLLWIGGGAYLLHQTWRLHQIARMADELDALTGEGEAATEDIDEDRPRNLWIGFGGALIFLTGCALTAASWLAAPLAFLVCLHQTLYVWRQMRRSRRAETGEAAAQEAVAAATRNATLLAFLVAALTIYLAASGAYG